MWFSYFTIKSKTITNCQIFFLSTILSGTLFMWTKSEETFRSFVRSQRFEIYVFKIWGLYGIFGCVGQCSLSAGCCAVVHLWHRIGGRPGPCIKTEHRVPEQSWPAAGEATNDHSAQTVDQRFPRCRAFPLPPPHYADGRVLWLFADAIGKAFYIS